MPKKKRSASLGKVARPNKTLDLDQLQSLSDYDDDVDLLRHELWMANVEIVTLKRVNSLLKEESKTLHAGVVTETRALLTNACLEQHRTQLSSLIFYFLPAILIGVIIGKFLF